MKSAPLESLDSEVLQPVSGVFVGPFASGQRANNMLHRRDFVAEFDMLKLIADVAPLMMPKTEKSYRQRLEDIFQEFDSDRLDGIRSAFLPSMSSYTCPPP